MPGLKVVISKSRVPNATTGPGTPAFIVFIYVFFLFHFHFHVSHCSWIASASSSPSSVSVPSSSVTHFVKSLHKFETSFCKKFERNQLMQLKESHEHGDQMATLFFNV